MLIIGKVDIFWKGQRKWLEAKDILTFRRPNLFLFQLKLICHNLSILAPAYSLPEVRVFDPVFIFDSWSVFEPTSFFLMGHFYIVSLKCSSNLGNCDFTVMFDPKEIFFVTKNNLLNPFKFEVFDDEF